MFVLSQATPVRGMERAATEAVAALRAAGVAVEVRPLVRAPRAGRIGRARDLVASFAAARRLVRQPGPPLVLVGIWVGLRVLPWRRPGDRAVVAWEHSLTRERRAALRSFDVVARLVLPLYARRAARVVAVSASVAAALVDQPGVAPLVVVVPNPVTPTPRDHGLPEQNDPHHVSEVHDHGGEGGRLLYVGGLEPLKNPELTLAALALLPGAVLDVAGGGARLARLQRRATELGVADRVVWHGHTHRVPELLAACDAVVHPSLSETFGYALLEAASAHRPVVAVATRQALELVPALVPGTTTAASAPALADAVLSVLAAPPTDDEFAAADAARDAAYDPRRLVEQWREVLAAAGAAVPPPL